MGVKLKVLSGKHAGKELPITKKTFTIGRASDCQLRPGSDAISRHHCRIEVVDGRLTIRDLGSRNGTQVNGETISEQVELKSGDHFNVGPLEFEVMIEHRVGGQKRSKVKSVAEAADRSAEGGRQTYEDEISNWLVDDAPRIAGKYVPEETQTIELDQTGKTEGGSANETKSGNDTKASDSSKKEPGKLPPPPPKPMAKDSCEAAADVLREMMRRR